MIYQVMQVELNMKETPHWKIEYIARIFHLANNSGTHASFMILLLSASGTYHHMTPL